MWKDDHFQNCCTSRRDEIQVVALKEILVFLCTQRSGLAYRYCGVDGSGKKEMRFRDGYEV